MSPARPDRRLLRAAGAQALFIGAACVTVPVSAAPPPATTGAPTIPPAAEVPAPTAPAPKPAPPAPKPATPAPGPGTPAPKPATPEPKPATPAHKPATAPTRAVGATVIRIGTWSAAIERGDQAVIDRCKATLYWGPWPAEGPGTVWLAGHNQCGFGLWADLPIGTTVAFTGPHGTGSYVIVGRTWVPRKGGPSRGLVHNDLILQTCQGQGTSLTYASRRS